MLKQEYSWLLPLLAFLGVIAIAITNYPKKTVWYQDIEDYQISSISVTELASWIIEGRNDFLVFSVDTGAVTSNIPNLVTLTDLDQLEALIKEKPNYKKWILLTGPSGIPNDMAARLTQDWKRRVMQVKGGGAAWQEQVSGEEVDWGKLSPFEAQRLREIRPFFHHKSSAGAKQQIYIAPKAAPLPFLQAAEEEAVEEGC